MFKKCDKSLKKTLIVENNNPNPRTNIKLSSIIKNRAGKNFTIFILEIINSINKKAKPIKKLKRLDKIVENGTSSLGNIACFNTGEFTEKEFVTSPNAFIEKIHGMRPASTKKV